MNVRVLAASELTSARPIIETYPFKSFRNYRVLTRKAQAAVMSAEISQTLAGPDGVGLLVEDGQDAALAIARRLDWDSRFFGVPMGRIDYLLASDARLLPAARDHIVDALRARGVQHVAARADVADIRLMSALEEGGFRLMDALVTYTTRPRKELPKAVREVGTIRPFRTGDAAELLEITRAAYADFKGRFHLDPHLPAGRADAFYLEWARQCVTGTMADMMLVSEGQDGRLVGFLAFRRREPVSSIGGVAIYGGGLGACRPDVPGGYAGLIRAGTIWAHERDGVAECQTQNYNFPTIRIYEAVGAHYVRAEYTLHRWVADARG